jgi:hypothetical protein
MLQKKFDGDAFILATEFTNQVSTYRKNIKWFNDEEADKQLGVITLSLHHLQELVNYEGDLATMETTSTHM